MTSPTSATSKIDSHLFGTCPLRARSRGFPESAAGTHGQTRLDLRSHDDAEHGPIDKSVPKLTVRVRFPSPAPELKSFELSLGPGTGWAPASPGADLRVRPLAVRRPWP